MKLWTILHCELFLIILIIFKSFYFITIASKVKFSSRIEIEQKIEIIHYAYLCIV